MKSAIKKNATVFQFEPSIHSEPDRPVVIQVAGTKIFIVASIIMLRSDRYNRNSVCVRVCLWMPARGKFNVVRGAVLMEAQAQQNADDGSTYLKAGGAGEGGGGKVHSVAARGSHAKGGEPVLEVSWAAAVRYGGRGSCTINSELG